MTIDHGIGPPAGTAFFGTRVESTPGPSPRRGEPAARERAPGAGDRGRFGRLGRLFERRGREWAEAVRMHQDIRRLDRLTNRLDAVAADLEPVKQYPPYPIDEPRRAEAIRRFNGVAAHVAVLLGRERAGEVPVLSEASTTEEVQAALDGLARAREAVDRRRDELAQELRERAGVREPEVIAHSSDLGAQLAAVGTDGLAGGLDGEIREIG
jgi:hypothetical protein